MIWTKTDFEEIILSSSSNGSDGKEKRGRGGWRGGRGDGIDGAYFCTASCLSVVTDAGPDETVSVWLQKGSKISVPMKSAAHFKMVIYEFSKYMTGLVRLR